jgi:hypothetical protein
MQQTKLMSKLGLALIAVTAISVGPFLVQSAWGQTQVNQAPVARITADPDAVNYSDSSALDATGSSDSDGNITKYEFSQTDGTPGTITVNSTNPAKATYEAPYVSGDETDTIQVKVTDNYGATDTASVNIVVYGGGHSQ